MNNINIVGSIIYNPIVNYSYDARVAQPGNLIGWSIVADTLCDIEFTISKNGVDICGNGIKPSMKNSQISIGEDLTGWDTIEVSMDDVISIHIKSVSNARKVTFLLTISPSV